MNKYGEKMELKLCPFCNARAEQENTIQEGVVRCTNSPCGAKIVRPHPTRDFVGGLIEAIEAWNRRAS